MLWGWPEGRHLVFYGYRDGPCCWRVPYDVEAFAVRGRDSVKARSLFGEPGFRARKFHRLTKSESWFVYHDKWPCLDDVEWRVKHIEKAPGGFSVDGVVYDAATVLGQADIFVAREKLPLRRVLVNPRLPVKLLIRLASITGCDLDRVENATARFFCLLTRESFRRGLFLAPRHITFPPYQGGLMIRPLAGTHSDVTVYDFRSLYPSICQAEDLKFPAETESPGVLATILGRLRELRAEVPYCKMVANSLVGMLGARHAMPAPALAARITARGRELLQTTRDAVDGKLGTVIYGHTDSIFVLGSGEVKLTFPAPIELAKERVFETLVLGTKMNRYFGLSGGRLHVKGFESKTQCPLEVKLQRQYMMCILRGESSKGVWDEFNREHPAEMYILDGMVMTAEGWKTEGRVDKTYYRDSLAKALRRLNPKKRTREDRRRELVMKLF